MSLAAGNATLWKPSPTTPLSAIAVTKIVSRVLEQNGVPGAVAGLVCGDIPVGEGLVASRDIDMGEWIRDVLSRHVLIATLVSFTGSERVGKIVGKNVQDRFGKVLLELGGNNGNMGIAMIEVLSLMSLPQ